MQTRYVIRHKNDQLSGPFSNLRQAENAAEAGVAAGLQSWILTQHWHECRSGQSQWLTEGQQCGGCGDR
ncbi:MAG: hypothetical protein NTY19_04840 [Planctomycetota bacterium]|nr:hypothetical protein [Planctomycetota bacterium]